MTQHERFGSRPVGHTTPDACKWYRHKVRSASLRAISFLSSTYQVNIPVRNWPSATCCSGYTSEWKNFLSSFLISFLSSAVSPFSELSDLEGLSLAASLNSVPKTWPDNCDCMSGQLASELCARLTKEKPQLPGGYLEFVRSKIRMLFPRGFKESSLLKRAEMITPPFTSTTVSSRSEGGSYEYWEGQREAYLSAVKNPQVIHCPQFMVAKDAGKPRPLVKNHPTYLLLKPLHRLLYDKISHQPWLLRGPPSRSKLLSAGFSPRGVYLSADFSAATDNLPIEVAESIIEELAFLSPSSLSPVFAEALSSLRPSISGLSDRPIVPSVGQLMGNLLSFPLLCLQNWLAAEWVDEQVGETTAKLINGDDLVVEASERWCAWYRRVAPGLGLNLNEKKTAYSSRFLTINSQYFSSNFKVIPFVKCRGLATSDPRDLADAMNSVSGDFASVRSTRTPRLQRLFLSHFERMVRSSGRSLYSLGFRFPVQGRPIPRSLWRREKRLTGSECSVPSKPSGMHPCLVQIDDDSILEEREIAEAIVDAHWEMGPFKAKKKESVKEVLAGMRASRSRRGKERAAVARTRLREKREERKKWVPFSIAECLQETHSKTSVDKEGFVVWSPCALCDKVLELRTREMKEKKEREVVVVPHWVSHFDVTKDGLFGPVPDGYDPHPREPDVVW
ncbi:RNA dependent RNA polymerase [Plasmopara viticola lesion associated ourmia-like virus 45]|uniref:RNA dependent RNA polymerase n=1 Tax=Plasmopara viticola lesion associated ourmia-like virus 45 TaxID=2686515 RepID=A0ABX6FIZ2_9VIRU|nr:RNA dependent RNA polymerase [Plasmopara viticola lesion associated ourmia-like virus 45]QGY72575.1 RNA dependent RNA polymerase [Plasmopara viticola lesion associated ourmia-like virus 45]